MHSARRAGSCFATSPVSFDPGRVNRRNDVRLNFRKLASNLVRQQAEALVDVHSPTESLTRNSLFEKSEFPSEVAIGFLHGTIPG